MLHTIQNKAPLGKFEISPLVLLVVYDIIDW